MAKPRRPGRFSAPPGALAVAALLAAFVLTQYAYGLAGAFINDDYIFLDKTRHATLATVWAPRDLLFHYYRPWSRELHFAVLQGLFGARPLPFHVAGVVLWLAVMVMLFLTLRRMAGVATASLVTACVAALGGWAVPLLWASGAQDLWMLLFALIALSTLVAGRPLLGVPALALALLSKENAVMLPAIAIAWLTIVERSTIVTALRRTWTWWAVVVVWAAFHPLLGGRWRVPIHDVPEPGVHPGAGALVASTSRALVNLAPWPNPEKGWGSAVVHALPAIVLLTALAGWGLAAGRSRARAPRADAPRASGRIAAFGALWALLGWLPLALPSIAWRSHYVLFGALGAWLAIGVGLVRRPVPAVATVALLALLRSASGDTVSQDWSSEWYRRRADEFMRVLRADLMAHVPAPPHHARFWFVRVPSHVGFLAGDGPALRVWYGDSTLRGGYYSAFRARTSGEARGPDYFFRFDSAGAWVPVVSGAEDTAAARRANPRWEQDHVMLATTLANGGDWTAAAGEYMKLAHAAPERIEYAYDAAVACESFGDSTAAAVWYARAAALPDADEDARAMARRFARYLPHEGRNLKAAPPSR
jgi:hypothetical protein